MNKTATSYVIQLFALTAVLMAIHYYIYVNFFDDMELYLPIWGIYAFNAAMVLAVFGIVWYQVSQGSQKAYQIFLSLTGVKMLLSIIFLLPIFMGKSAHPQAEVINCFLPYFCFLAFEIVALNKFLQKQ